MNGSHNLQLSLDFRTGRPTSIPGDALTADGRSACAALNRERARGLTEADRNTASRESLSPNVWATLFARKSAEWGVPLTSLRSLGISHDEDGLLVSDYLVPLKSGAEASPFWDKEWNVVYKLFPLLKSGGLGKTFSLEYDEDEQRIELITRDALLFETVEKLVALSEAGALPTEIVGLADSGDYLIAKQPLAKPYEDFEADREEAVAAISGVVCRAPVNRSLWVVWMNGLAAFVSDLHVGNIMRTSDGKPTIIDALFSPVPGPVIQKFRWLSEAVEDAKSWRINGHKPLRRSFDQVNDNEL